MSVPGQPQYVYVATGAPQPPQPQYVAAGPPQQYAAQQPYQYVPGAVPQQQQVVWMAVAATQGYGPWAAEKHANAAGPYAPPPQGDGKGGQLLMANTFGSPPMQDGWHPEANQWAAMQAVTSQYQPYQPYQAAVQDFNPMKGMCYNCGGDHFAKECLRKGKGKNRPILQGLNRVEIRPEGTKYSDTNKDIGVAKRKSVEELIKVYDRLVRDDV